MDLKNEMSFLEEKAGTYKNTNSTISEWSVDSYLRVYTKYIEDGENKMALELGCSNGYSTKRIAELMGKLDVIDGSNRMLQQTANRVKNGNVSFKYGLFENIKEIEAYDLEHSQVNGHIF